MTFPIVAYGSYLLRHFCDVTNKACFGRFNAIDWPIKTSYFRNNFRSNGPISKTFAPKVDIYKCQPICKVYSFYTRATLNRKNVMMNKLKKTIIFASVEKYSKAKRKSLSKF